MDFSAIKSSATCFVQNRSHKQQCGPALKIAGIDEEERQIMLKFENLHTFSLTCPSKDCDSWTLWSESSASQSLIQDVMDKVDLDRVKDITQILEPLADTIEKMSATDKMKDESSEEEDDDDYYTVDDLDVLLDNEEEEKAKDRKKEEEESSALASPFSATYGSPTAVGRLVKDLKIICTESPKFGIHLIGSPEDSNLFVWDVKLTNIPLETKLGKDLKTYAQRHNEEASIQLKVLYPSDYPFSPPFIRVVKPRFKFLTGHVTVGGSICMEVLTKSGWTPSNDIESVLVQVRTEILSDPRASLDPHRPDVAYTEEEAKYAFDRMVKKYGWT